MGRTDSIMFTILGGAEAETGAFLEQEFFFFVSSLRDIWTQRPTYRNLSTTPTIPTCFLFIYQLNLLPHDLANAPTFLSRRVDFRCRRAPSFL